MARVPPHTHDHLYARIDHTHPGGGGTVDTVTGTAGEINVNDADPANLVVSLDAAVAASLALADTAVQPGDLHAVATSGDHGALAGLGDDDHTQYVLRSILTTNGDLFVRAAGVIDRLGVGTEGHVLKVVSGAPAWAAESGGGGGAADFTDLGDVPSAYTGFAGYIVGVNGTEDGLEFVESEVFNSLETEILADSPIGYWKLDEASGDFADSSGNSRTLTAQGSPSYQYGQWVPREHTRFAFFDASGDGASRADQCGLSLPVTGDWTFTCVAVVPTVDATTIGFFSIGNSAETEVGNHQIRCRATGSNGVVQAYWESGAGTDRTTSAENLRMRPGVPVHLAWVKDSTAGTVSFYKNGVLLDEVTYPAEPTGGSSCDTRIAAYSGYGVTHNPVGMAHAALFDSALSASRIRAQAVAGGFLDQFSAAVSSLNTANDYTWTGNHSFEGIIDAGAGTTLNIDAGIDVDGDGIVRGEFTSNEYVLNAGNSGFADFGSSPYITRSGSGWSTPPGFVNAGNMIFTAGSDTVTRGLLFAAGSFGGTQGFLFGIANGVVKCIGDATEFRLGQGSDDCAFYYDGTDLFIDVNSGAGRLRDSGGTTRLLWNTSGVSVTGGLSATGVFSGPDGSVTVPAYGFTSDADTGTYLETAGRLTMTAAGEIITRFRNESSVKGMQLVGQIQLGSMLTPSQITANQNDYDPESGESKYSVWLLSSDASRNITGIATPNLLVRTLFLMNIGSNDIVLVDNSGSSTAAYRLMLGANITIGPNEGVTLIYTGTTNRWRCVGKHV